MLLLRIRGGGVHPRRDSWADGAIAMDVPAPITPCLTATRLTYAGKVRDLWSTPSGDLLFVATDQFLRTTTSCQRGSRTKGKVLTALSLWWFDRLADVVPNHGCRSMFPVQCWGARWCVSGWTCSPVECVARGYLTGSGLSDYQRTGAVCGVGVARRSAGCVTFAGADLHARDQGCDR